MSKLKKIDIQMMMIDDVPRRIKAIREYIMDKENSLEDRLEIFLETPEHLKSTSPYIVNFDILQDHGYNWTDDYGIDKYQEVDLVYFLQEIKDNERLEEWTDEDKNTLYYQVLNIGVHSFTYDW